MHVAIPDHNLRQIFILFHCFRIPHNLSATESAGPSTSSTTKYKGGLSLKSYSSCTIRVVQATKSKTATGKVEFESLDTIHLNLTTSTANTTHINTQVQKKWGAGYIIVSNDGLPIGDSTATRGMY